MALLSNVLTKYGFSVPKQPAQLQIQNSVVDLLLYCQFQADSSESLELIDSLIPFLDDQIRLAGTRSSPFFFQFLA